MVGVPCWIRSEFSMAQYTNVIKLSSKPLIHFSFL